MQRPLLQLSRRLDAGSVCWSCLYRLSRDIPARRATILKKSATASLTTLAAKGSPTFFARTYFSANDRWIESKFGVDEGNSGTLHVDESAEPPQLKVASTTGAATIRDPPLPLSKDTTLPHRRRKRRDVATTDTPYELPPDASSQLSTQAGALIHHSFRQRFLTYLSLSKPRLTFLMVLTTTTAYSLFPVAITPLSTSMSLSPLTLLNLTTGTALSSACANALNMMMEPAHDAKMSRTRTRPLVRGLLTQRAAAVFAAACGISGVALLHFGVNPTVAFLSALNIFLYAGVYTPMKRIHIANTWVGAVVGGIPPLMGWAAAAGQASSNSEAGWRDFLFDPATSTGGWLLAALLFAWQFPHFNAIAFTIRHEYAAAGYKMLASVNVRKNGLIALRYSLAMMPICAGLCFVGVTGWGFVATSGIVNGWMIREAWRFWRKDGAKGSARGLFWASVWHLPLILVLAMVHKRGMWERFFKGGFEDDEEMWIYVKAVPVEDGAVDEVVLRDRVA